MKELFYLSHEQIARIKRYFPRSHGIPRVDDRRVVSGIIYVIKHGLQWKDAPREYGPYKTLYNRFIRWSRLGVFNRIFAELVEQNGSTTRLMIDATHLKAHRTAASLLKKGPFPMYRTHKRRPEFKTPRCLQCLRSTVGLPSVRRSGERLQRRCCPA